MKKLDQLDQQILNEIQQVFPVVSRPYQVIGNKIGLTENEAFQRISRLRRDGFIRRLGGIFDSKKLGYVSTLCAVSVPVEMIDRASEIINQHQGVTHHYQRDHHYNLWFTLIMESRDDLRDTLKNIEQKIIEMAGDCSLISLPAKKIFKLKVQFKI